MTAWTEERWAMFFELLDKGWPGELDEQDAPAYRVLLGDVDPERIVAGLRRLLHHGARFRPSAAELLAAGRRDPGRPTFPEALRLIFGVRGVLRARPEQRRYDTPGERHRLYRDAALQRASLMHPLIGAFVQTQGLDRLRELQLEDPDYGPLRRKELEAEWNAMLERFDERQVAADALPVGDARRGQLHSFDPLVALATIAPAGALPAGKSTVQEAEPC
jgi:hypothetical protein